MKKRAVKRIFILLIVIGMLFIESNALNVMAKEISVSDEINVVTLMGVVKLWKYKKVDGKLYKRAYNAKTKQWMTDWILVK